MNEKNTAANRVEEPGLRITRARAKSLGTSGTLIQKPPLSKQSQALKENSKRLASDENKSSPPFPSLIKKRKTTLTDVTNVLCDKSYAHCCTGVKFQKTKPEKKGLIRKNGKVPCSVHGTIQRHRDDPKDKIAEDISKLTVAPLKIALSAKQNSTDISSVDGEYHKWTKLEDNKRVNVISSEIKERLVTEQLLHEEAKHYEIIGDLKHPIVIDIDRNQKDPLMCNLYVSDIYEYKRVIELNQRLSVDYMEIVQRDITPSMRGILIDWLVEVSEEYKLVPDTLYLTVNLIDRYLSGNFIEKQKLQLLGVACMFIASKYEEMNAPQVEDFCYITANTYARKDVLKMERKVLNFLYFQLSVPTIKTFLRRYIHVAQATYKDPLVNLEFLADYLAELTLVEYSFFRFLPSLIAASAVFLARWTLDQSDYPWNPTLEFYTGYKVADLKVTVIAMQDLQLNTINSPLNAIREKYRHDKFNCVANLSSPDPVESLF